MYTDGSHLTADSLDELYGYATRIGLNPDWIDFMGRNIHPHFDICGNVKQRVLADINVQKVSCRDLVKLCIRNFRIPEDDGYTHPATSADNTPGKLQLPTETEYERMIDNIFNKAGLDRT